MAVVNASPILLLMLIFTWSYWAYNVSLSFTLIQEGHYFQGKITAVYYYLTVTYDIIGFAYILFYHPIFILCLWSYWTVCRTSPGYTTDVSLLTPFY